MLSCKYSCYGVTKSNVKNAQLSNRNCPNQGLFLFTSKSSFRSRQSLKLPLHATGISLHYLAMDSPTE